MYYDISQMYLLDAAWQEIWNSNKKQTNDLNLDRSTFIIHFCVSVSNVSMSIFQTLRIVICALFIDG